MVMDAAILSLLFLFLLLLLGRGLSLVAAGSNQNLTVGSSLSSSGPNSSLSSPSGDFAFGFWPLDTNSSLFLLAVPTKSTLQLTQAGQLSLFDSNGQEVWSPDATNAIGVSLLDSGNLVLYDSSGALLWQSFQNPTDTILPGQSLGERSELRSKMADTDFSFGRFMLAVQDDGNLALYPVAIPTGSEYYAYWASNTQNATKLQLVFNSSGSLYYQVENGNQIPLMTLATVYSPTNFYQHATLDPDGALRLYTYPKNNNNSKSTDTWAVVGMLPINPCLTIQTDGGGGACGLNAYCNSDDDQSKQLDCKCVSGCKFVDTNRPYLGCTPNFTVQSCDEYQSSQYTFNEILNMDWPEDSYEYYAPTDEDTCRASCLADCFCSVAVFQGSKCSKKKMPLLNGRQGISVGGNALIKVPQTNASFLPHGSQNSITMVKKDRSTLILIISALLGSSGFLNMLFIIAMAIISFSICNRTKDKKNQIDPTILGKNVQTEAATEEAAVLAYWAHDCFRNGRLDLLVDGDEEAMIDVTRVERFVTVAIWCILEEPSLRPSMRKVAQMLEGAVAVPVPPDPSSYISSIV
uniref:non-specific serine/threonine protein kinase n=1 Tax=Ananas comosus var. bracteatus TaxID=296719 RepID=A0A6V7PKH3_ANACO|nr:unnamed protein product [Ananas comosus var. bracteatus]